MSNALIRIATDWAVRCFGKEHVFNRPLRGLRTLEEAAELAQALGVPEDKAAQCIGMVYSRPVGDPKQEIGGVLMTLAVLVESMGENIDELFERELRRCLEKSPEHFRKRNQEKLDLGLDAKMTTYTDQDGCKISRPIDAPIPPPSDRDHNYDHRTAGPASFFPLCTRKEHLCATIGQGPCNGLPRPFEIEGNSEHIFINRAWATRENRNTFAEAYEAHGFENSYTPAFYQAFVQWAAAKYRRMPV